ncbi:MAG: TraR/DksA family transcriptional regulator [Candidatus Dadabacteria bacterium]
MLENSKQEITDWNKSSKSSTRPVSLDESIGRVSRIDAIQNQQMALAAERRRIQELQRIEAALKRIDLGDYGYCMVCEEEISEKRLELDPAYSICVECASSGSGHP